MESGVVCVCARARTRACISGKGHWLSVLPIGETDPVYIEDIVEK